MTMPRKRSGDVGFEYQQAVNPYIPPATAEKAVHPILGGIKAFQTGITDPLIQQTQAAAEGTTQALTGKSLTEQAETEGGLFGAFQAFQGDMMKGGIGNIASSFGVEPRTLMIVGAAAVVGIVVLLVVLKT